LDIVVPYKRHRTGYLASTVDEYAHALRKAFRDQMRTDRMRQSARDSIDRFSDETFQEAILAALRSLPELASLL